MNKPQRILLIRLASIGDVLLTTPAIRILSQKYPDAEISYLVEEKSKAMVEGHPDLEQTFVFNKEKLKRIKKQEGIWSALRLIKSLVNQLQEKDFDLVIDFHSVFRSALFSFFSGPKRIGIKKQLSSILYTTKVAANSELHVVDEYLQLLSKLDIDLDNYEFEFELATGKKQEDYIQRLLAKYGIEATDNLIAFNPATSLESKDWPENKFIELGNWIANNLEAELIILGGPEDEQKADRIANKIAAKVFNLAGQTSLKELAVLLKRCDLLVTGDTGPMHIAMAQSTPLVALFGPTAPARFGPYQGNNIVLRSSSGDMADIRVETVVDHLSLVNSSL